jgi:hypothetical protein
MNAMTGAISSLDVALGMLLIVGTVDIVIFPARLNPY